MKLLMCGECGDIFNLVKKVPKQCSCGRTGGILHDDGNVATFNGDQAIPIGFDNRTLLDAITMKPISGEGYKFTAFTVADDSATFRKQVTS